MVNASFETPSVGSGSSAYVCTPTGTGVGWTFTGSGVSGDDSDFSYDNPHSPSGAQVAFLQAWGSFDKTIMVPAAGVVQVSFYTAQRASYS